MSFCLLPTLYPAILCLHTFFTVISPILTDKIAVVFFWFPVIVQLHGAVSLARFDGWRVPAEGLEGTFGLPCHIIDIAFFQLTSDGIDAGIPILFGKFVAQVSAHVFVPLGDSGPSHHHWQ